MKFYLTTVQYNREAKAENRTVPKVYPTLEEAEANFHEQVGKDMKNPVLGGSVNLVFDSEGNRYSNLIKKWGFMEEPEPTPEVTE